MAAPQPELPQSSRAIEAAVSEFGSELGPRMRGDGRKEDRLRQPISALIKKLGTLYGFALTIHDEVTLVDLNSRPDIAIDVPTGRLGYIELKAPGKGVPDNWRVSGHDERQWNKFKSLPNLVYTDGNYWALYRKGVLVGSVAKLDGDLSRAGHKLVPAGEEFEHLIRLFLHWRPEDPRSLRAIVAEVAPLCRLLRDQVEETLEREENKSKQPFTKLALEWRSILFPSPGKRKHEEDARFADSYAQAVTFGLLLARLDGVSFVGRSPSAIAEQLSKKHSLLGEALAILANPKWVGHLNIVDTLVSVIGNIDWASIYADDSDTYAKLYETFLGDYDPELRKLSGTYYTPVPVARAMVGFVDSVLKSRLNKERGFAARDVVVLDPAMGAGTFLAEVLETAVKSLCGERRTDAFPAAHLRELFSERLVGFEVQAAPFAVAELRLHAVVKTKYQVELPPEEPRFLTDALDDPDVMALDWGQLYEVLTESRGRANRVKRNVPVMVVIGNPPWRERARGAAEWIEKKRSSGYPIDVASRPSLDEFRVPGQGRRDFNLNNMWTYFWRWSAWKAFEANDPAGIVALITPSSYVASEAYAGMRKYLREVADEGWIIDLSPEDHRSNISTRIFPTTQHPICIGVFVRSGGPSPNIPAPVHYLSIEGTQDQKFLELSKVNPDSHEWLECPTEWFSPFRPASSDWESYPKLGDMFPWQQTGVTSNRNWVWAPDPNTLHERWRRLVEADLSEQCGLFKETEARKVGTMYHPLAGVPSGSVPVKDDRSTDPRIAEVGFRSFDRQYLVYDRRVIDRPRAELWQVLGSRQVYMCEQHTHSLQEGPGLVFSSRVPNVDFFKGHHGGRVIPLYRDSAGEYPNLAPGLLTVLSQALRLDVTAQDVLAYVAGVTAHGGFTTRFSEDLKTPGVRVPLTKSQDLWRRAAEVGRRIIWLHSYGERMVDSLHGRPPGLASVKTATYLVPIPAGESNAPTSIQYEEEGQVLVVGEDNLLALAGRVYPVRKAVWEYSVGGMQVVPKWFDYRAPRPRYRRRTSPLDDINSRKWTAEYDDHLLELIDVLTECVSLEPKQIRLLEEICSAPQFTVSELISEGALPAPPRFRTPPSRPDEDESL